MNENIDLTEILKDCPKGTKLYSPLFGYVEFKEIDTRKVYSVNVKLASGLIESFTREGKLYDRDYYKDTECILFPSKEQRDWSKFTAPWYKKDKFDPKTLKPFDNVLVRDNCESEWQCDLFSYITDDSEGFPYRFPYRCVVCSYRYCIPYNDDTKYLVGTSLEAPEYYRYWED